ncbi:MAG: hypothetical protein ACYC5O_11150 [Anaerolineae bacterium]
MSRRPLDRRTLLHLSAATAAWALACACGIIPPQLTSSIAAFAAAATTPTATPVPRPTATATATPGPLSPVAGGVIPGPCVSTGRGCPELTRPNPPTRGSTGTAPCGAREP